MTSEDRLGQSGDGSGALVSVPRRWVDEVVLALDAATTIGRRSCTPGDGLNAGNHDRLIREAQPWSIYARTARSLPEQDRTTDGEVVVHRCPPTGSGVMPCCGRTPFEVPGYHRMTVDGEVTCDGF